MAASTLNASLTRLEGIKESKHLYNKSKIAEAEALAAEALRMANEAKLAAGRLDEVKKTLSMFSKKLDRVEQTVQKEVKPSSIIIEPTVEQEPVVLAAEALHMANEARLAAARLNEAKKTLSIFSGKQMVGVEQTVQKEVKPKSIKTESAVKKEPIVVVVKASGIDERTKEEPVKDEPAKEETAFEEFTKEETIEKESTKEEEATAETHVKESIKEDLIDEDPIEEESTKEEKANVETPVEESTKKDPIEDESTPAEESVKEDPIEEESTKEEISTVETPVEESVKKDPIKEEVAVVVEQVEEESAKEDPPIAVVEEKSKSSPMKQQAGIVSEKIFGNGVVKVIETGRVIKVIETGRVVKVTETDRVVKIAETERVVKVTETGRQKASCDSQKKIGNGVVRVIETGRQKDVRDANKGVVAFGKTGGVDDKISQDITPAEESDAPRAALTPLVIPSIESYVVDQEDDTNIASIVKQQVQIESYALDQEYDKDIIEEFLDSIGVDEICGVDDQTLGFVDRSDSPRSPPPKQFLFEMKTPLAPKDMLQSTSWKQQIANTQRKEKNLRQTYQRSPLSPVSGDYGDPFGVDHDDLVFCGKVADLCEPPDLEDEYYAVLEQYAVEPVSKKKSVNFHTE